MSIQGHIAEMRRLAGRIGRPVRFMEVCGTHTVTGFRSGLRSLLPPGVQLLSGPGCPVCVTPTGYVDRAMAMAARPGVVLATFGDMVRVPGARGSLERARAEGARVEVVYSPADALELAKARPAARIVFLGVGFETTAPSVAWTIRQARADQTANFLVACAHKTIPEAMGALLDGGAALDGYLCPGHVSVIIGAGAYEPLARAHRVPCVIAGFEAADMAEGLVMLLRQVAERRGEVEVQYRRSVTRDGNPGAQAVCGEVFEKCDTEWRGLGIIPGSGRRIREAFGRHDAERVLGKDIPQAPAADARGCRCGEVLMGKVSPDACGLFARACAPATPVGPCMVSSEGACAAWHKYGTK
ncbi:MAG: hydrogenase formation protein HypD [Verrucomicrobiota bacterium]|nr:hydrogenase formation protein HypD [Verrucomicrobiota bacterium]